MPAAEDIILGFDQEPSDSVQAHAKQLGAAALALVVECRVSLTAVCSTTTTLGRQVRLRPTCSADLLAHQRVQPACTSLHCVAVDGRTACHARRREPACMSAARCLTQ